VSTIIITSAIFSGSKNRPVILKASNGLAETDLHWVTNHKVQLMAKLNF